jgi:hypothetical protein
MMVKPIVYLVGDAGITAIGRQQNYRLPLQ